MRIRFLRTAGFRLSALYAGVFALSVMILGILVLVITGQALRDQIVTFARADVGAIRNGYVEGEHEAREVVRQLMAGPANSGFYVLQRQGRVLEGNLPAMAPRTGRVELSVYSGGRSREVLGVGDFLAPGLYVFSGSDLARPRAVEARILSIMLVLFPAAILIAVAGGALVSWSFLRRTDAMARACREIMQGDLKLRIPVRGTRDELDRLAEAINEMLTRISALMENLSQVSNDIAHDLRTPVTHLRNRLERARADSRTEADYRTALDTAIAKADEILGLFTALLRVAQIEGGERRSAFAPVELDTLLAQMRELFEPVAEEAGDAMQLTITDRVLVRGDRQLLVQLFSNLIENAIVHTPSGTRIVLSLSREAGRAVARVADNGPGVPREEHDRLFRRLYRREASRSHPGYGLGLALVAAIAELHGATVRLADGERPGLTVEISFPLTDTEKS